MTDPEWEQVHLENAVLAFESGWAGLWRHFKDVLRGNAPTLVPFKIRISAWVKSEKPVDIAVVQLEPHTGRTWK